MHSVALQDKSGRAVLQVPCPSVAVQRRLQQLSDGLKTKSEGIEIVALEVCRKLGEDAAGSDGETARSAISAVSTAASEASGYGGMCAKLLTKVPGLQGADSAKEWLRLCALPGKKFNEKEACSLISGGGLLLHFSGQGRHGLAEVQACYAFPTARALVDACSAALCEEVQKPRVASIGYYPLGLNVSGWIDGSEGFVPPKSYLVSAPVSYPLVGLVQLANYAATLDMLGANHDAVIRETAACVGHSQGIMTAALLATCKSTDELLEYAPKFVRLLMSIGMRSQQTAQTRIGLGPGTQHLRPALVGTAAGQGAAQTSKALAGSTSSLQLPSDSGDVSPSQGASSMLSITGLPPAVAIRQLDRVRKKLQADRVSKRESQPFPLTEEAEASALLRETMEIALVNDRGACVVAGAPQALDILKKTLEKTRADPGEDQSRVPHSKRKPQVRTRFLSVTAPFHTKVLEAAIAPIMADAVEIGLGFTSDGLQVPVLSTENGGDLRDGVPNSTGLGAAASSGAGAADAESSSGLLRHLVELQCCKHVDWPRALKQASVLCLQAMYEGRAGAEKSPAAGPSHDSREDPLLLDFGPGGASGAVGLSARLCHGHGITLVRCSGIDIVPAGLALESPAEDGGAGSASGCLNSANPLEVFPTVGDMVCHEQVPACKRVLRACCWARDHSPTLVRRSSDGKIFVRTRYTDLLGRPPVMVAGMTPCTSFYGTQLVAASTVAGYHAELAAGGLPRPGIFKARMQKAIDALRPGDAIGLNLLYLNPRQWAFQFPLMLELRKAGWPIDGMTIGAGVPTAGKAKEILAACAQAGLRFVAFKPGSLQAIRRTLEIAKACPYMPVVLQWTGGRAGGHHSFEDMHQPLMATYGEMRACPNLVLVAGSGIGDAESALPYITGEWSMKSPYFAAKMPFDAVLLGSRMMVAAEAATAPEVKKLLVDTPGVRRSDEKQWEQSYDGVAGGVLTVRSELGEPIHKIANRGMMLWREMDRRFFSLPPAERGPAVQAAKQEIIGRLNNDFQKVYFGRHEDGSVCDVEEMTYHEVLQRFVSLCFVLPDAEHPDAPHEDSTESGRWLDPTYKIRFKKLLLRTAERLAGEASAQGGPVRYAAAAAGPISSLGLGSSSAAAPAGTNESDAAELLRQLQSDRMDKDISMSPHQVVEHVASAIPRSYSHLLTGDDVDYFYSMCRSGGKPVPFVPCIDGDSLQFYFKKDSLWYSEDLAAVPGRDAGRVCILQGPVSVGYSNKEEPAADILGGIHDGVAKTLLMQQYEGNAENVPITDTLTELLPGRVAGAALDASPEDPEEAALLGPDWNLRSKALLAARGACHAVGTRKPPAWIVAALASTDIASGTTWKRNLLPHLFAKYDDLKVVAVTAQAGGAASAGGSAVVGLDVLEGANKGRDGGGSEVIVSMRYQEGVVDGARAALDLSPGASTIIVQIFDRVGEQLTNLDLYFYFDPARASCVLLQLPEGGVAPGADGVKISSMHERVRQFYSRLWGDDEEGSDLGASSGGRSVVADEAAGAVIPAVETHVHSFEVTRSKIEQYAAAIRMPVFSVEDSTTGLPPSPRLGAVSPRSGEAPSDGTGRAKLRVPVGFSIVASWGALVAPLLAKHVNGNLMDLVHLSHKVESCFDEPSDVAEVVEGDLVCSRLALTRMIRDVRGLLIQVEGVLSKDDETPWVRMTSKFLVRDTSAKHATAASQKHGVFYERKAEQYTVKLSTDRDVGRLRSMPWLQLAASSGAGGAEQELQAGSVILLRLWTARSVGSDGSPAMTVCGSAREIPSIGHCEIDTGLLPSPPEALQASDDCKFDEQSALESEGYLPDASELRLVGSVRAESSEQLASLDSFLSSVATKHPEQYPLSSGYTLLAEPDVAQAPLDNTEYALASQDLNPIHRNRGFAVLAQLPGPITHGMWTYGNCLKVVVHKLLKGNPKLLRSFEADFVGMVLPGEQVTTQLSHVAMSGGAKVVQVEAYAASSSRSARLVLKGTAQIVQPRTAIVFTGQGYAAPGMGMDLYDRSEAARKTWDHAERVLQQKFGFSILKIVRENPKELRIYFGGKRGAAIRENYRQLRFQPSGSSEEMPLLPSIGEDTESYQFMHPRGLLFATYFTQVALVLLEKAAFEDARSKGVVPKRFFMAGHSLGEYASLSAATKVLNVDDLCHLVFLRGLVMQNAVPRDELGRSDFGMMACNPYRVSPMFSEDHLHQLVSGIQAATGYLLQLVNYNVIDWQYVVTGHLEALAVLTAVLNTFKAEPSTTKDPPTVVKNCIAYVRGVFAEAAAAGEHPALERGVATIPLPGVDVPFHSRFLLGGVPSFRKVLQRSIHKDQVRAVLRRLDHNYVPNLVAMPFETTFDFCKAVADKSSSERCKYLVALGPGEFAAAVRSDRASIARDLVIELLAYQFASPVQWIATQHVFFTSGVQRMLEIGPAVTLTRMAMRTLQTGKYGDGARELLYIDKDSDKVFFSLPQAGSTAKESAEAAQAAMEAEAGGLPEKAEAPSTESQGESKVAAVSQARPVVVPPAPPVSAPTNAPVAAPGGPPAADSPPTALDAIRAIVAVKTGAKSLADIKPSDTLKALCGGQSALQNEIVGELEAEFGPAASKALEGGEDKPLQDLAAAAAAASPGYQAPGKSAGKIVSRVLSSKLPGGFGASAARGHLQSLGLGTGSVEKVLLYASCQAPKGRFGDASAAKQWLEDGVSGSESTFGVTLRGGGGGGGGGSGAGGAAGLAALLAALGSGAASGAGGPSAGGSAAADSPPTALDAIRAIVAVKTGAKSLADIKPSDTLKALCGGQSALQNEIVGELEAEFGPAASKALEGGEDKPLQDLAAAAAAASPGYQAPGKSAGKIVSRVLSSKLPGGFGASAARGHLQSLGLGTGSVEKVLLYASCQAPKGRFGDASAAKKWLEDGVSGSESAFGVTLRGGGGGGGGGSGVAGAGMNAAALIAALGSGAGAGGATGAASQQLQGMLEQYAEAISIFLQKDDMQTDRRLERAFTELRTAESRLDQHLYEHGETYLQGIQPKFDALKAREYRSWWNWCIVDLIEAFHEAKNSVAQDNSGAVRLSDEAMQSLRNRATKQLVTVARYLEQSPESLSDAVARSCPWSPTDDATVSTPRGVLSAGTADAISESLHLPPILRVSLVPDIPKVEIDGSGKINVKLEPRQSGANALSFVNEISEDFAASQEDKPTRREPMVSVRLGSVQSRPIHARSTVSFVDCLRGMATDGVSFAGKCAIVTGCGRGSIGAELLKALLAGGANIIATTSSFSAGSVRLFRGMFERYGSKGSSLTVVPFNQGSQQDVRDLVRFAFEKLGDVDFLVPFAAISENGRNMDKIDDRSELAHRIMLTNVLRLIGEVKKAKEARGVTTRPALALLPMSPNHGLFGGDGLYAESKLGLESLLNKWGSEGWQEYISVAGAIIGWTRGTGLMSANDIVAEGVEEAGLRTFSTPEMAALLVGLMHPAMVRVAGESPIIGDFSGGFDKVPNLKELVADLRKSIQSRASMMAAKDAPRRALEGDVSSTGAVASHGAPRANSSGVDFPALPSAAGVLAIRDRFGLRPIVGSLDLDSIVVCTGFGEVGPFGSSRLRWEIESTGELSIEGCIELAWATGRIKYHNGPLAPAVARSKAEELNYQGWVNASTGMPVDDTEVKAKFEEDMLRHAGCRLIEPAVCDGFEPHKTGRTFLRFISLDRDMPWVDVASEEEAMLFRERARNDAVDAGEDYDKVPLADARPSDPECPEGPWQVRLRKGAVLGLPRALRFDRWVAGQVPTGWDATRFGVPAELASRIDRVTLFTLVAAADALISSGITDPYELYRYVHVSEVGNTIGSGVGGLQSLRVIFRTRREEEEAPADVLYETFINTVAAWVNMLLLSSSGPIKTPVGACATAAASVDIAVETIQSGKARVVVAGGVDDFAEESSYEFAQMKATSSAEKESKQGREPADMSRPMTTTRGGFMESQGSGVQVLMSARLAIDIGAPIYGVIALTSTASDKAGRSVPAPGQGVLTTAREKRLQAVSSSEPPSPTMSPRDAPSGAASASHRAVPPPTLPASGAGGQATPAPAGGSGRKVSEGDESRASLERKHADSASVISQGASTVGMAPWSRSAQPVTMIAMDVDPAYRRRKLDRELRQIEAWRLEETGEINEECGAAGAASHSNGAMTQWREERLRLVDDEAGRKAASAKRRWMQEFWKGRSEIAPIRGALGVFGLGIDDLAVASFHGTGTKANDVNESEVTQRQMMHLGRSPGNPLLVVAQKYLTGHPKGSAAAWMLNGLMQSMLTGVVPGNRNADDIEPKLQKFWHLAYPNRSLVLAERAGGVAVPAALLKSFGFGQAGGEIVLVHPSILLAALPDADRYKYETRRDERERAAYRYYQNVLTGKRPLLNVKTDPPFSKSDEPSVYLDPEARAIQDGVSGAFAVEPSRGPHMRRGRPGEDVSLSTQVAYKSAADAVARLSASGLGDSKVSVGVDVQETSAFAEGAAELSAGAEVALLPPLLQRNFTRAELEYCRHAADPAASLAARWAAKEATFKAVSSATAGRVQSSGAGAPLLDAEVSVPKGGGPPTIRLSGAFAEAATSAGLRLGAASSIAVSISHSGPQAVAVVAISNDTQR